MPTLNFQEANQYSSTRRDGLVAAIFITLIWQVAFFMPPASWAKSWPLFLAGFVGHLAISYGINSCIRLRKPHWLINWLYKRRNLSWPQIERAIRQIDSREFSSFQFHHREPNQEHSKSMDIVRIEATFFQVIVTTSPLRISNQHFYLMNSSYPGHEAGNLPADPANTDRHRYTRNELESVLQAAKTFEANGEMDPNLTWASFD